MKELSHQRRALLARTRLQLALGRQPVEGVTP
jgi:hypothetical protein